MSRRPKGRSRAWTPEELALIEQTPATWPRFRKLTDEQLQEIRRRVDSLTTPWTPVSIAADFGVSETEIIAIARRLKWKHRKWEPEGRWWREIELEEMERERQRRKRERERLG